MRVTVVSSVMGAERAMCDKQRLSRKLMPPRVQGRGRHTREPPQPSWHRAMRRGGMMGALMLAAFLFLFKNAPIGIRLAWGVFYAAAFVPLTYFIDRTAYRSYQRRLERNNAKQR